MLAGIYFRVEALVILLTFLVLFSLDVLGDTQEVFSPLGNSNFQILCIVVFIKLFL